MNFKVGDKVISNELISTCNCTICKDAAIDASSRKMYKILSVGRFDRCIINVPIGAGNYLCVIASCLRKIDNQLTFSFMDD